MTFYRRIDDTRKQCQLCAAPRDKKLGLYCRPCYNRAAYVKKHGSDEGYRPYLKQPPAICAECSGEIKRRHPYTLWEDWRAGMWRRVLPEEEEGFVEAAVRFTGDAALYGSFMLRVTREWPYSCEHNLTDIAMNRRAWVGHAAACIAIQCPEYLTRRAWWMLSQTQRDDADEQATAAIAAWHRRNNPQLTIEFEECMAGMENRCST